MRGEPPHISSVSALCNKALSQKHNKMIKIIKMHKCQNVKNDEMHKMWNAQNVKKSIFKLRFAIKNEGVDFRP